MSSISNISKTAQDLAQQGLGKQKRWRLYQSTSSKRLERALPILIQEHAYLESLNLQKADKSPEQQKTESRDTWLKSANALIEEAKVALYQNDAHRGWTSYKGAARYHLYGMGERNPELLTSRAQTILQEANEKLKGWRKESIQNLLAGEDGKLQEKLSADNVVRAAQILDDHFDNMYQKLEIQQQRLFYLVLATVVIFSLWLIIAPYIFTLPVGIVLDPRLFWAAVACLGSMGAVLSAFSSASKGFSSSKIPDALADGLVTISRIAIASISATLAVFLLVSGVINLGEEVTKLVWVLAIAAGFSERLVVSSLENLSNPKKKE
jgi:hypothetical protein